MLNSNSGAVTPVGDAVTGAIAERDLFDKAEFYRLFWRRSSVVYRGEAFRMLNLRLGSEDAMALAAVARTASITSVVGRADGGMTFVNQVQRVSPRLRDAARTLDAELGWRSTTFDLSVSTTAGVGIGCHFDHSDNLVLQQEGAKLWRVGSPEDTGNDARRARMLEVHDFVPTTPAPGGDAVLLAAGDMLYVPLFAPHEGIAKGPSVSVSASFNAESPASLLGHALMSELSRATVWWSPLPLDIPEDQGDLVEQVVTRAARRVIAENLRSDRR